MGNDEKFTLIAARASRPGAEAERAALAKVLATRLADPKISADQKVQLLRHIQRIGKDETVIATAALLYDAEPKVADAARRALVDNPSSSASTALRSADENATDDTSRAVFVAALGYRRDPADAAVFVKAAASDNDAVRIAGLVALGRVGGTADVAVIKSARERGSDAARRAAVDAQLTLADRVMQSGGKEDARALYRDLFDAKDTHARCAAIVGLASAGDATDFAKTIALISDKDPEIRGAVLTALRMNRSKEVADAILAALVTSEASTRPWLIRALVDQRDPRGAAQYTKYAADPDSSTRIAALNAIAKAGNSDHVVLLVKSAAIKPDDKATPPVRRAAEDEKQAARDALDSLNAQGVDDAVLVAAAASDVAQRVEVLRAIGTRRISTGLPALIKSVGDADQSIRGEALKSLSLVADFDNLNQILPLLASAKEDADRDAVGRALADVIRKNADVDGRAEPILEAAKSAELPLKTAYIKVLGQIGGERAKAAVLEAIRNPDPALHEAGVRALAAWPDPSPMSELLVLAKEDKNNTLAILALRGYIRMAGMPSQRKPEETVELFVKALAACKRSDEKKAVLGGLGNVRHPKSLEIVLPMIADEALTGEASAAAINIARELVNRTQSLPEAKNALAKVLETSKNEGQKKAAKELLDKIEEKAKKPA
jgi:HEAT repeat protein